LNKHADVRVLSLGLRLPLDCDRYEHVSRVEFPQLLTFTGKLDIGIAPLVDTAFNRSRSNVKLKEYSSGGAAWLASPVGPYLELGEKQGGELVADEDWPAKLNALVESPRRRRRLAKRGLRWAKSQAIEKHARLWEEAFASAIASAQVR
jgi:hypothetical protein